MTYGGSRRPDLAARLRLGQRALRDRLSRPDRVLALLRAAHDTVDPALIGQLIVDHAVLWFDTPACGVFTVDPEGQVVTLASSGFTPGLASAAATVARRVLATGAPWSAANFRTDPWGGRAAGAVAAWPLVGRARVCAVLVVIDRHASTVAPALSPVAQGALLAGLEGPAQAIDSALRLRRAEALSVTDDLTELYNSRYLHQVLRRESKRASRSGRPLSLVFLDLDGFKSVNDHHGHQAGSRALVEAAAVVRGSARETDVAVRFGGDEFAIILPDTGSDGAEAVACRVQDRVARHVFLAGDGLSLRLTVSVGVATLPDVAASADELLRAADLAMYRVKDSGKNGVCVAQAEGLG